MGFTEENKFDFPIITCDDATESIPVIYFRGANQTAIYEEANCIIAEAKREADFLRIKDRLIFGVFGVIE